MATEKKPPAAWLAVKPYFNGGTQGHRQHSIRAVATTATVDNGSDVLYRHRTRLCLYLQVWPVWAQHASFSPLIWSRSACSSAPRAAR